MGEVTKPTLDVWGRHRSIYLPMVTDQPLDVAFENIKYSVSVGFPRSSKKEILHGLTGHFKSGELTAIMGPSGAGKSTLLNVLTGFQTEGMSGTVRIGGVRIKLSGAKTSRKNAAYIMQDDRLDKNFTAREVMVLAAKLKLGVSISKKAASILVDDLLDSLLMTKCADTRCGQLSGGQQKRLSIALELIDNPTILFLDEPTTGLDSTSCSQLITLLKGMAKRGKTIICTIHQPSASLFEMLDHVYVVGDGKCLYQGTSCNVVPFLSSINLPCPQYHNPADFLLDVISGEFGYHQEELMVACQSTAWRRPSVKVKPKNTQEKVKELTSVLIAPPSELYRTLVLIKHLAISCHRDWITTYLKLSLNIFVGLLVGLFYSDCGQNGKHVVDNIGFYMVMIVYTCFISFIPATLKFPNKINILKKERFNNWYTFKSYFIAFFFVNIPIQVFMIYLFVGLSYFLSNQVTEILRLSLVLLVTLFCVITSEHLGIALGTANNPSNAIFLGSVGLAVMVLFAGFAVFLPHMPTVFYYASYLSIMRHALECMIVSAYGLERPMLPCPDEELYCYLRSPQKILSFMGFEESRIPMDLFLLSMYSSGAILLSYFWVRRSIRSR